MIIQFVLKHISGSNAWQFVPYVDHPLTKELQTSGVVVELIAASTVSICVLSDDCMLKVYRTGALIVSLLRITK